MTQAEWLASDDANKLLLRARFRSSRRKCRLFAVACCRLIWPMLVDARSRAAVEVAERFADEMASEKELLAAGRAARAAHQDMFDAVGKAGACAEWAAEHAADPNPFSAAKRAVWMTAHPRTLEVRHSQPGQFVGVSQMPCSGTARGDDGRWVVERGDEVAPTEASPAAQAALVRCIFVGPFRAGPLVTPWLPNCAPAGLRLARDVYEHRELPEGRLDAKRLAVLADAVEEAGCADPELLAHLRGPGPHVRGCWALDLVLGKS